MATNTKIFAAAIQMASSDDVDKNLRQADELVKFAIDNGAEFVLLPENFGCMVKHTEDTFSVAEPFGDGKIQSAVSRLAEESNLTIVAGSIPINGENGKARSACIVYGTDGEVLARYDKKHLFDVYIEGSQETYRESDTFIHGSDVTVIDTCIGKVGLSICYDIRFPEMYRKMIDKGVQVIIAPSAFTEQTGRAHWEPLLRARAIENLCYVIAANQSGLHANERKTYGNSMIIDPWGKIISRIEKGTGVIVSEIDLELQKRIRAEFPALSHR